MNYSGYCVLMLRVMYAVTAVLHLAHVGVRHLLQTTWPQGIANRLLSFHSSKHTMHLDSLS